jgi:hypothetical protein
VPAAPVAVAVPVPAVAIAVAVAVAKMNFQGDELDARTGLERPQLSFQRVRRQNVTRRAGIDLGDSLGLTADDLHEELVSVRPGPRLELELVTAPAVAEVRMDC